jgi:hypothetical protein
MLSGDRETRLHGSTCWTSTEREGIEATSPEVFATARSTQSVQACQYVVCSFGASGNSLSSTRCSPMSVPAPRSKIGEFHRRRPEKLAIRS